MTSATSAPPYGLARTEPSDAVADAERMAEQHLAKVDEVEKVGKLVRWLDDLVRVPGTRFGIGLDAILGAIFPGVGDAVTGVVSLGVLSAAIRRGVPRVVVARMFLNIAIDTVGGLVPIVGDVFDLLWRSNVKNLALLERHQHELEPRARTGDYAVLAGAAVLVGIGIAAPIALIAWVLSLLA
jgi:hypothetical protein